MSMSSRRLSVLLALVLVVSLPVAAIQPAAAAGGSSNDVFTESALEGKGLIGLNWDGGEDVVRYGGEGNPGWIVEYEAGHADDLESWAQGSSSRAIRSHANDSNMMVVSAPPSDVGITLSISMLSASDLSDRSYVERISVNRRISIDPIPTSQLQDKDSWSAPAGGQLATWGGLNGDFSADGAAWGEEINTSSLDDARAAAGDQDLAANGSGVRVAIVDTGLAYDSELYGDRVVMGKNTITNETINASAGDYAAVDDGAESRHGSWIATAIAGNGAGENATGVAPGAEIVPVKAISDDGSAAVNDVGEGLEYACGEANADIVSMSLGGPTSSMRINSEIQECFEDDGVSAVVVAGGNNRMTYRYLASPGDSSEPIITVAASDARSINESESAYFSAVSPDPQTGEEVDLAAPGMKITAETADGNRTLSGTSMATPLVSGAIATTLEERPSLKGQPVELRQYVSDHAEPMEQAGTTEVGNGRLAVDRLVNDELPDKDQEDVQTSAANARDEGNEALSGSKWRGAGNWLSGISPLAIQAPTAATGA